MTCKAAAAFAAACGGEGLDVHAFDGEGVRVTIGLPEDGDLLIKIITSRHW